MEIFYYSAIYIYIYINTDLGATPTKKITYNGLAFISLARIIILLPVQGVKGKITGTSEINPQFRSTYIARYSQCDTAVAQ